MVGSQWVPEKRGACALGWVKAEGCLLQDCVPGTGCASALFVCLFLSHSENYPGHSWKQGTTCIKRKASLLIPVIGHGFACGRCPMAQAWARSLL